MFIKKLLYKTLSLKGYLRAVSRMYFLLFRSGMLRGKKQFDYPYFLSNIIHQGDTVIDIGANLGYYSAPMARIAGPEGHLYAIEPVAAMREVLKHNLRKFKNVTIYPYALGAEDKEIMMGNDSLSKQDYLGTGVNTVLDENTGVDHAAMEFPTRMKRGSELFAGLPRLDFIKCDIEGYEGVVISEMLPLIEAHHPTVLMETGSPQRAEMVSMLNEIGYRPYVLKGKRLHKLQPADGEDILFIHISRNNKFKQYTNED